MDTALSWQKRVSERFQEQDYAGLLKALEEIKATYDYFRTDELRAYLRTISTQRIVAKQDQETARDNTPYFNALEHKLYSAKERYALYKVDVDLGYEEVKELIRRLAMSGQMPNGPFDPSLMKLPFIITNSYVCEGMVLSQLFGSQRAVRLVTAYTAEKLDGVALSYFGHSEDARGLVKVASFVESFWLYRFQSSNGKVMILLSKSELELQYGKVRGMIVELRDSAKIGDTAKIPVNLPIVFVYDQVPSVQALTTPEFGALVRSKAFDREKFSQHIFGAFRHPPFFEKLLLAWLFSGKYGNPAFPLHFGWLSIAGGGKSAFMERLSALFEEKIAGGSGTTMGGLVPNYGGTTPDEGYLCQRRRLGLVDEFFAIVRRHSKNQGADNGTDLLQEILEHRKRVNKSGRGEQGMITTNPRMKVFTATNTKHYHLLRNMQEIADNMNNAFLSRWLWYVQTSQHIAFVDRNKGKVELKSDKPPVPEAWFLELFDYCYTNPLDVEISKVEQIVQSQLPIVPERLHEVYRGRMHHHVACLVDGIAKVAYICGERADLQVQPSDYEEARELLAIIVGSWNDGVDLMKLPVKAREHYLTIENRDVYDYVCHHLGITGNEVAAVFKEGHVQGRITYLKANGLIREDNYGKLYPFWSNALLVTEVEKTNERTGLEIGGTPKQGSQTLA